MSTNDPHEPVLLARCANEFEAELKASVLRAAGIGVKTITSAAGMFRGVGPIMGAGYEVYVKRGDLEAAYTALREAKQAGLSPDSQEWSDEEPALSFPDRGDESSPVRARGLSAPAAFALGAIAGMLTSPVPIVGAVLMKAPLGRPEMTVMLTLWVITFGFLAYNIRDRLPAPRPTEGDASRQRGR